MGYRNSKFVEFSGMWKISREHLPHLHDVYQHLMELRNSQCHGSNNRGNFQCREKRPYASAQTEWLDT